MDFRRAWLGALAPLAILACKSDSASTPPPPDSVTFPASFMFGTATAGFQIEKADSHTDWADWVALSPSRIKNGDTPDNGGPDALNHFDDDIALMTQMGQNAYRFSIEWGRIFPTQASFDSNTPDEAALAAYDTEIQKLQNAHITPLVTLFHWALPNWLSDVSHPNDPQGWERPETSTDFTTFCSRMAQHFGGQVDWWVTLNEPLVYVTTGYVQGGSPPGVLLDATRAFNVARALARAHASCFDAIHQADTVDADGDGKAAWVSVAKHQRTFHPEDPTDQDDVDATKHVHYLWNQWFLNATIRGDWDDDIDGNTTGPNDKQGDPTLKGRMDYIGVNYYSDTLISAHRGVVIPIVNAAVIQDHLPTDRPKTDVAWDIYPEGLRSMLEEDVAPYSLPVVITENGIADRADVNRARFLAEHLYQLGWAMKDGLDVRGYFLGPLMDNFEWQNGFCPKFGFASVDPQSGARTLRGSGAEYRAIASSKILKRADIDAMPAFVTTDFLSMKPPSVDPKSTPLSSLRPGGSLRPAGFAEMDTGKVFPRPISAPDDLIAGDQAQLLLLTGTNAGQVFSLDGTFAEFTVGRGQSAQISIEDVEASRAHCKITVVGDGKTKKYVIEDLRSKNGTYVNADPIEGQVDLNPGDRIHLGPNLVLRFSIVDAAEGSLARQLYETSTRDALTKSYNRRYFVERLESELAFAQRHKTRLAIVMLDLDHFKQKNDKHGHMGGDAVLRAISSCVQKLIRAEDVFARYGGEEFILLVRGISHENVHLVAERVRRAIERLKVTFDGAYLQTTVSIGISSLDEFPIGASIDSLVALADKRLYAAKSAGRNQVCSVGI